MRRIFTALVIFCALLSVNSCGTMSESAKQEQAQTQAAVAKAIANLDIYVDVNTILPVNGSPRHTLGEYSLTIKDGKVSSYLPFFGVSRNAAYGSTDSGIKFKDVPIDAQVVPSAKKKGLTTIYFEAKSFDDVWSVSLEVWDTGKANIYCTTREKTAMQYYGDLKFDNK